MARCNRCNKFSLIGTKSGYCAGCEAILAKEEAERQRKAEEERRRQEEAERQRKAEEERRRQEEAERQRKAEEEQQRIEEENRRIAEAERQQRIAIEQELKERRQEEERQRQEEVERQHGTDETKATQALEDNTIKEDYVLSQRSDLEKELRNIKEQLDNCPPHLRNTPRMEELYREYQQLKTYIEDGFDQYEAHKKRTEAAEAEQEARRQKARDAAIHSERGETDDVHMYITLLIESIAGDPNKEDDSFVELYADDFPAQTNEQIIDLRKRIQGILHDEAKCAHYEMLFSRESLEDRFNYSTGNLFVISSDGMDSLDAEKATEFALSNTYRFYTSEETPDVLRLMKKKVEKIKSQLEEQLHAVDPKWNNYSSAKEFLLVSIEPNNGQNYNQKSHFQRLVDQKVVTVKISTKGMLGLSAPVSNIFCWYWNSNVVDIWIEAMSNGIKASSDFEDDKGTIVATAFEQIRQLHMDDESDKLPIVCEYFSAVEKPIEKWIDKRVKRAVFVALAYFSTHPIEGGESRSAKYVQQAILRDTIYMIRKGGKLEVHFYGEENNIRIVYLPLVNYGYWQLVENIGDCTEDTLDEYFTEEKNAGHIDRAYHVEFEEFQVTCEQINDAVHDTNE